MDSIYIKYILEQGIELCKANTYLSSKDIVDKSNQLESIVKETKVLKGTIDNSIIKTVDNTFNYTIYLNLINSSKLIKLHLISKNSINIPNNGIAKLLVDKESKKLLTYELSN